ncbi:MAG: hypothetical protein NVS3B11_11540 [Collimonas sp.]
MLIAMSCQISTRKARPSSGAMICISQDGMLLRRLLIFNAGRGVMGVMGVTLAASAAAPAVALSIVAA